MHELIEQLEELMNDENRIVTVPLFAQEAQISFKEAREVLNQFVEIPKNSEKVHATYVLNGIQKNTGKLCLIQVNNETIEALKDSFENEPEKSIFSIQKPKDINYNVISMVDKIQDFSKFGTIVGKNCIKRSIKKRILPTLPVPTIKGKSSMFLKQNISESIKIEEKNISNNKKKEAQSNNAKTSIESLFNKSINAGKKSKVSEKKTSKENTALSGFFTKSSKEAKTVNTTIKLEKENLENKSNKAKDYVFDSDTDEEGILNDLDFHKEAEKTQNKVSTSANEKVENKSTTSASSESTKSEKTKSLENSKKKLKFESNSKSSIKSLFDKSVEAARQCSKNKSSNLPELKSSKEKEALSGFLIKNSIESKTLKTANKSVKEPVKNSGLEENKFKAKDDLFDSDTDEDILNDLDYHKEAEITKKLPEIKKSKESSNKKSAKKRKRIVVEDNNSDSDNDIVGSDKSDDVEIIESSIIEEKSSKQSAPRSKRRKTIAKVCEDDDGFLVTKYEHVFETASEEENNEPDNKIPKKIAEAPPKPSNKLQQQKTSSNSEMEISPTEGGNKKKKSTKSKPTNQPTLMNFFKKK